MDIYMHLIVNLGWNIEDVDALRQEEETAEAVARKQKMKKNVSIVMKPIAEKLTEEEEFIF